MATGTVQLARYSGKAPAPEATTKLRVVAFGRTDFRVLLPDGSTLDGVRKVSVPTTLDHDHRHNGPVVAEVIVELDSFFAEAWPQFNPDGLRAAAGRAGYQLVPDGTVRFDLDTRRWVMCNPWAHPKDARK